MGADPIFHLALASDWAGALAAGEYAISTRGQRLDEVGFVHCSTAAQLAATADRFYADVEDLVVLTIEPDLLTADVRYEPPVPGADEVFPHVYGPIPVTAVTDVQPWRHDAE